LTLHDVLIFTLLALISASAGSTVCAAGAAATKMVQRWVLVAALAAAFMADVSNLAEFAAALCIRHRTNLAPQP
jgi:bacteriorhodopsin